MNYQLLGNRIPYEYFITKGKGESNAGSEGLPYETGSYDAALNNAGIENCNVIEYTSVIPTEAKQISKEEGLKRSKSIIVMSQIYPSGVIFKNFNTDVDQLSEIYENLDNLYPNIANNPEKAKEIIERLTSKNRNISIAEFKSILENANNELNS
jgi:hypothetical protein